MLTFPVPAALNGDALAAELRAAGVQLKNHDVSVTQDQLCIVTDADRATVQSVVQAHVPPPPPADPEVEFRKALEGATTVAQIRDALLGKVGPGAEPRGR